MKNNLSILIERHQMAKRAIGLANTWLALNAANAKDQAKRGDNALGLTLARRVRWQKDKAKAFADMNKARSALTKEMLRVHTHLQAMG